MIQSNSSKSKTTFNLLKYSRGRVPENDQQDDFSQSQSQSQPPSSSQFQSSQPPPNSNSNSSIPIKWEHFTHPVLTCSVEQTFASTPTAQKAAQSLLVNIQWRISSTDRMTLVRFNCDQLDGNHQIKFELELICFESCTSVILSLTGGHRSVGFHCL